MNESERVSYMTIFDWDDTLFPSSFIEGKRMRKEQFTEEEKGMFHELDDIVCEILCMSMDCGGTYIVSNASMSWINFSSGEYLPKVHDLLVGSIPIISTRLYHSYEHPDADIRKDKCIGSLVQAMENHDRESTLRLFSIGDSTLERNACLSAIQKVRHCVLKSIKMLPHPSFPHLLEELRMIAAHYEQFSANAEKLDLRIEFN